ncbi:hypothetical protein OEA41_001571 [Lepraria neglecta]|uniref:EamA domain-containing protein n=1 Tax=Lepraria neglecta TaxID=209136 RepID=A0AAD9ZDE9_9LECA|nr:hypothetical protein OEA41_001571 [Lepraria neglecta]
MEPAAEPLIPEAVPPASQSKSTALPSKLPWIPLAAASGACAAFNGVFAKLTTTDITSSWAAAMSTALSLSPSNKFVEFLIRAFFFSMNLAFNALMWALFTSALTRASSTTRVSIINTSANFMLTAFSGWMVFGEKLPGLWWVGAAGLVVGNVVIGRRDEDDDTAKTESGREGRREGYRDDEGEEDGISDGVELVGEGVKGGGVGGGAER